MHEIIVVHLRGVHAVGLSLLERFVGRFDGMGLLSEGIDDFTGNGVGGVLKGLVSGYWVVIGGHEVLGTFVAFQGFRATVGCWVGDGVDSC